MKLELERKFLHDIASPISLIRIQIALMLKELNAQERTDFLDKLKQRLEKMLEAAGKLEELHADHKIAISPAEAASSEISPKN